MWMSLLSQRQFGWMVQALGGAGPVVMEVDLPDLGELLKEVGPLVDANEVREQDASWLVCFEEDLGVLIETDEARLVMVMTTELGHPSVGSESLAYKQLLQVGANWQRMAGLHMVLDPSDDMVLQIADVCLIGLDLALLAAQLQSFADTARHCRRVLRSFQAEVMTSEKFVRV
jgi:hypothetical protein